MGKKLLIVLSIIFVVTAAVSVSVLADEAYYFERYDVDIHVNSDYTFDVEEKLVVNFTSEKHGIYRHLDNKWGDERIKYSNISVEGALSSVEKSSTYTNIRIGDADKYVFGTQYYTIKYTIAPPLEKNAEIDAVYMNVLGFDHNTVTMAGDINVYMPSSVDPMYLAVMSGYYGGSGISEKIEYEYIDRNQLHISIVQPLDRYEGITVKMDLPEGYFQDVKDPFFIENLLKFGIPIAMLLIGILIWAFNGVDKRVVLPVVTDLDDFSPAEAGYIIDGVVDGDDIASMLIYWASKGYIRIETTKKNSYRFYRLADTIDAPEYEKVLFDKIFIRDDEKGYITTSKVKSRLSSAGSRFKKKIEEEFETEEKRLLTKRSVTASKWVKFLCYISLCSTIFLFLFREDIMLAVIMCGFLFVPYLFVEGMVKSLLQKNRKSKTANAVVKIIAAIGVLIILYFALKLGLGINMTLLQVLVSLYCFVLLLVIAYYTQQMTEYGHRMYERVLGFRHFMDTAEKDWIDRLAQDDPEYYYDKLPYALVLGVSRTWIGRFSDTITAPPSWYSGNTNDLFVARSFSSGIISDVQRIGTSYDASTRSSSGSYRSGSSSFSSGGGFSGGGFSGGGSSSW